MLVIREGVELKGISRLTWRTNFNRDQDIKAIGELLANLCQPTRYRLRPTTQLPELDRNGC